MPVPTSTLTYPFDPTGNAASNLVIDEQHSVNEANYRDYYFIVPIFAPFFAEGVELVITTPGGVTRALVQDIDYTLALLYSGATRSIGKAVYGGITLSNAITDGIITIRKYQTLGGGYTTDPNVILNTLAELVYNPRTTVWDGVTNKPSVFPPINHTQDFSQYYDEGDLLAAMNDLVTTIASRPAPIINLADTQTAVSTFYNLHADLKAAISGTPVNFLAFAEGQSLLTNVYWSILHWTTSPGNFAQTTGALVLSQTGTVNDYSGTFSVTATNTGSEELKYAVILRTGSQSGPVVAISEFVELKPSVGTSSAPVVITAPSIPNGVGINFHNDLSTGFHNPSPGVLSTFVSGHHMHGESFLNDNGSQTLSFGPNCQYKVYLQTDGDISWYDGSNLLLSFRTIATQTYVQNLLATTTAAITNAYNQAISNNVGNFLPLNGAAMMTGCLQTAPIAANVGVNDSVSGIMVRNNSGQGDTDVAAISFLCETRYGIKLHLRSDGYFGIGGWSRNPWSWYSDNAGNMVAAGNVIAYSDPRLKEDVVVIRNALDICEQIDGVRFTWNDRSKLVACKAGKRDVGILANQVKAVLPEIVYDSIKDEENDEVYDTVAYDKLVPVLLEAIKELRAEVSTLRSKVDNLIK